VSLPKGESFVRRHPAPGGLSACNMTVSSVASKPMPDELNASKKAGNHPRLTWIVLSLVPLVVPPSLGAQQLAMARSVKPPITTAHKVPLKEADDAFQLDLRHQSQRYRLSPSDQIQVSFPFTPAFDQALTIQPDGFVTAAEIGDIRLEGLTTEQASEVIQARYARILDNPVVSVELKDFRRPYFIVAGEVNKPGKYELRGFTSVTEALAVAGGFNGAARRSLVLLFRRAGNEWYEVKALNLKRFFQGQDVSEDVEIRPGDMLVVSATVFSRIRRLIL